MNKHTCFYLLILLLISLYLNKNIVERLSKEDIFLKDLEELKKKKKNLQSNQILKNHKELIKDSTNIYFSKYKCLDYEDLKN